MWRGNGIPATWLVSNIILICNKTEPQDPRNYRPIYVSMAIYGVLTRLLLKRKNVAMAAGLLDISMVPLVAEAKPHSQLG